MKNPHDKITLDMIRHARIANLYTFLDQNYPNDYVRSGTNTLSPKDHDSLFIKKTLPGYHAFSTGEHGNSLDYLIKHLHYGFADAVYALLDVDEICCDGYMGDSQELVLPKAEPDHPFVLPEPASGAYMRTRQYLASRGFPEDCLDNLVKKGLLYQEKGTSNAVFVNPQHDFCELRGTSSKPFHGIRKTNPTRFWYITNTEDGVHPDVAFITEGAIDAVSLYLLQCSAGLSLKAAFIGIGGVANQKTIDRVKQRITTILAVDNDEAGNHCRMKNADLRSIYPHGKDWNEDLTSSISPVLLFESLLQHDYFTHNSDGCL